MKRKKLWKGFAGFLAGTMLLGLLAGCGEAANDSSDFRIQGATNSSGGAMKEYDYYDTADDGIWTESNGRYEDSAGQGTSGGKANKVDESANTKRKLIKTVNMTVETQEYDILMQNLEARIKELGGYIQKLESNNGSSYSGNRSSRNASLTVRIPQANLDSFVGSISELANIVRRSESVDDITLTYVDLQSHKESLQVEQERLLNLLEKAETLEDIITLENRLTSVRYQIESMESQLRTYDDQVDYSTIYLGITEVKIYTPTVEEELTAWKRMVKGFEESIGDIRDALVEFGVWVVVKSPYLIIWGGIITAAILLVRRRTKKLKRLEAEKKAKNGEKKPESPEKPENPSQPGNVG